MFDLNKIQYNSANGEYNFSEFRHHFKHPLFHAWLERIRHNAIETANSLLDEDISSEERVEKMNEYQLGKVLALSEHYESYLKTKQVLDALYMWKLRVLSLAVTVCLKFINALSNALSRFTD